jgi:hypothetical protein
MRKHDLVRPGVERKVVNLLRARLAEICSGKRDPLTEAWLHLTKKGQEYDGTCEITVGLQVRKNKKGKRLSPDWSIHWTYVEKIK